MLGRPREGSSIMPTLPNGYNQGPNSGAELAGAGDWYDQIMRFLQQSPQGTPATPQAGALGQNALSGINAALPVGPPGAAAPNPNPPGPGPGGLPAGVGSYGPPMASFVYGGGGPLPAPAAAPRPGGTPTSSPAAAATATPIPRPAPAAVPGSPAASSPNLGYYPPNPRFGTFQYNVPGSGRGGAAPIYTAMNLGGGPAAAPQGNPSATPSIPGSATALAPGAAPYGPNLPATPWKGPSAAQQATAYGWPFNMLGALARGPVAPGGSYSP
jgi:hypothetical protein